MCLSGVAVEMIAPEDYRYVGKVQFATEMQALQT